MNLPLRLQVAALALSLMTLGAFAVDVPVNSVPVQTYRGVQPGQPVDKLIWQGGIVMTSPDATFGGLSGITYTGSGHQLVMASDEGNFVSGHLIYDEAGQPLGLGGVTISPIRNSKGAELPRKFAKDAEAIETIKRDGVAAAIRVGFENLTRIADFDLVNGMPEGAAREVAIPQWLEDLRTNRSLESICIAPPASPVAGSTLLLTEGMRVGDAYAGFMLGQADRGDLSISRTEGLNPTDCAFLPNGDLLVLERGTSFLSFVMQVRHIAAAEVKPGNLMRGEVVLTGSGGDIDNMEGIAVHPGPDGKSRITIISDDNFNDWERSLLLEFSLAE